ncbi:MAG: DUF5989 family protein [Candidatus Aenigmatarchaeota archaeon]
MDILKFIWKTKKWWLVPLICLLFILGLLTIAAQVSPVPLFMYPLI